MAISRNQVKALSTMDELELFDNSRPSRLKKLTESELKDMVKRSRALRNKLRDLATKQTRVRQSEKMLRGMNADEKKVKKADLYSEVYDAFVSRLADLPPMNATVTTTKKPSKKARNIEARTDRTAARQRLLQEKKKANITERKPAVKVERSRSAQKTADTKTAKPKELLASAATSRTHAVPGMAPDPSQRSAKATFASKAAVDRSVDYDRKPQTAARQPSFTAKVIQTRFTRSAQPQRQSHTSSTNKRNQGRKDSK
jgi:hypothetical protein